MLDILRRVAAGELRPEDAEAALRADAVLRVGETAALDPDRARRTGIPEVVLADGKRPTQVAAIVAALLEATGSACVSRMRAGHRRAVEGVARAAAAELTWYGRGSCRVSTRAAGSPPVGMVGLIAAGTSDLEALAEARMVCDAAGVASETVVDVGVAGIHRLFPPLAGLLARGCDVVVVAAGMDGALASVVAGLVDVPVVGLPVSTGYGAGGRGQAALLSMLQGCAPGLVAVNVDNGVGAGAAAALVALGRAAAAGERAHATGAPASEPAATR